MVNKLKISEIAVNIIIKSRHTFPLLIKVVLNISRLNKKTKTFINNNGIISKQIINKNS